MRKVAQISVWDESKQETKSVDVTHEQVINTLECYDRLYPGNDYIPSGKKKPWTENNTYHYAVWNNDRFYPPKVILRCIIGKDKRFWGGNLSGQANAVLRALGFKVTLKPGLR